MKRVENANMESLALYQYEHGQIYIPIVVIYSCMTCVVEMVINVKNILHFHLSKISLEADKLKAS